MLELAGHCFLKASECEGDGDGEEWLVEYMLGKVSEKQQTEPGIYLKHYLKVSDSLNFFGAPIKDRIKTGFRDVKYDMIYHMIV